MKEYTVISRVALQTFPVSVKEQTHRDGFRQGGGPDRIDRFVEVVAAFQKTLSSIEQSRQGFVVWCSRTQI